MELIVRIGEREERVEVVREGDTYRVRVGERSHRVDAAHPSSRRTDHWSLLVDGRQSETVVREERGGTLAVSTGGTTVSADVADPLTHLARQAHGAAAGAGAATVTAYMPGRVVAILAEEGSEVTAGQGVVVLEAMKMENEIAAERAGTLRKIHVEVGQAVEGGDPLFEVV